MVYISNIQIRPKEAKKIEASGSAYSSKCQVYGVKNLTFNLASSKVEW
jgi:hypothetical protein